MYVLGTRLGQRHESKPVVNYCLVFNACRDCTCSLWKKISCCELTWNTMPTMRSRGLEVHAAAAVSGVGVPAHVLSPRARDVLSLNKSETCATISDCIQ